jgi:pimeloyl-ACP methyl ester carboxylesterase
MPVVLFSHGWSSFRGQSTHQLEELASRGFLVAALQHPFGAILTIFPDGSQAPKNSRALPTGVSFEISEPAGNILVDQWARDMAFVLDTLAAWNRSDPQSRFTGRLDLEKVAVMGHSTGGGATIEFCARDPRCKAGIGLDAYLGPVSKAVLQDGLEQPILYLYSEEWPSARNNELFEQLFASSRGPAYAFTIQGTDHYDFSDLPLLTPLAPAIGLKGPLPASRVVPIIDTLELAFLKQHLLGEAPYQKQSAGVLTQPQTIFPEVITQGQRP